MPSPKSMTVPLDTLNALNALNGLNQSSTKGSTANQIDPLASHFRTSSAKRSLTQRILSPRTPSFSMAPSRGESIYQQNTMAGLPIL